MAEKPRIKVPQEAHRGETIEIRTLLPHAMENGLRRDENGNLIPRRIINRFTCTFDGRPVFSADFGTSIAANPYLQFTAKVDQSGTFRFSWFDDDGTVTTADEEISVS